MDICNSMKNKTCVIFCIIKMSTFAAEKWINNEVL